MKHCQNCGAPVFPAFARVFGDDNNDVYACTDCTDNRLIKAGKAAGARRR